MTSELRMGISSCHFEWRDLDEAFRRCRSDLGFDVLEIWATQIEFPPSAETCTELRRLSREHDLAISYHAPYTGDFDLAATDAPTSGRALKELLLICGRMDAEYLILHLGSNEDKQSGLRYAMSAFSQNEPLIEKYEVKIAVEVVPSIWGSQIGDEIADFEQLFRTIDKPWLGFNLDYGHAHINGHLHEMIDALADKIIYTHVQDTRGESDDHLAYGMGSVDWPRALARTFDAGFRGPFVIEYHESHGRDKTDKLLADLKALAEKR